MDYHLGNLSKSRHERKGGKERGGGIGQRVLEDLLQEMGLTLRNFNSCKKKE